MPPKVEIKNGSKKPKTTKGEKEPFDAAEHKVILKKKIHIYYNINI